MFMDTSQEYLYRTVALATGGWAAGPWQRGRSRGRSKITTCDDDNDDDITTVYTHAHLPQYTFYTVSSSLSIHPLSHTL